MKVKDKFCKQCGEKFKPYNSLQPVCSPKCALVYNSSKEVDKRVKVMRKESRSLSELKTLARSVFQTWIRKSKRSICISCGSTTSKLDAGHFYSANQYSGLIFNEDNCWPQCHYCNRFLHGSIQAYATNLIMEIGDERFSDLNLRANIERVKIYSKEELNEIIKKYKLKLKEYGT